MRSARLVLLASALLTLAAPTGSRAQDIAPPFAAVEDSAESARPTVTEIRLRGNNVFDTETLLFNIRTRANRNFLGIPGFALWRWIYRLGESTSLGGLSRALRASGEPPAYLDPELLASDAERLELFYQQEGYRRVEVDTRVDTLRDGRHLRVVFDIRPGKPTFVRRLAYDGLQELDPAQRRTLFAASKLVAGPPTQTDSLTFTPDNLAFSQSLFREERRYLMNSLRDQGYATVTRDSIRAFVTPVSPDTFDVRLDIRIGERMRYGDVYYLVNGPESAPVRIDTLRSWSVDVEDDSVGGWVVARYENEGRLRSTVMRRAMRFEPGAWFSQSELMATKRRLEATGLFSFSDFMPLWASTRYGPAGDAFLPYRIQLRTRRRHQLRWEFFMLSRDAVLGEETGSEEVGVGLGMSYRNANLAGTGESFQVRTSGSIAAAISGSDPFNTAQGELETALVLPYLVGPLRRLDRALNLFDARTRFSMRLLTARREELRLIIRGRASLQAGVEARHSPTLTSLVSLVDFNLSDPDTLLGFERRFLGFVEDPVERERILEDYSRPQVNNALRYTLRSSNTNLFRRDDGYVRELSVELGGNLPYLFDRFVFSPDVVEGSIPGIPLFRRGDAEASRLIYRQYVRLLGDVRTYSPVGQRSFWAWKIIGGWSHPIGAAPVVPFDRRFYSGGASSVRGWGLRELGPGRIGDEATEVLIQGGDVKLEASLETRTIFLRNTLAANWMSAVFVDAGNVWYGPRNPGAAAGRFRFDRFYRDIGVGSGLGLRIAWEYLILRLDLAYRVHDPASGFFPDGLRSPRLHFGIGQAF